VLVRQVGRRPRVAPQKTVAEFLELGGITHYAGQEDPTYRCRVLLARIVKPDEAVRRALNLGRQDTVFCLERLRSSHGSIFGYEKTWINRTLCPGIERHDFSRESLYRVFRGRYNLAPSHSQGIIDVMVAGRDHAELLGVKKGTALLCVHRTVYAARNRPLQVNHEIYRGDRYRFAYKAGHTI
jgi:GntR family transcriptional regulator